MKRQIDISPEYCPKPSGGDMACLTRNGYERVYVGGSYSGEAIVADYLHAIEAGGHPSGVYAFVHFDGLVDAKQKIDNGLRHVRNNMSRYFMLDMELESAFAFPAQYVRDRLTWAVNYTRSFGVEPLIYTGPWWWDRATAEWQETWGAMAVIADYVHDPDNPPPLWALHPVGGWSVVAGNVYGWQYAGTVDTCGLNTDRILVVKEAEMAFDAQKRATQDAALRQLAGDALNDNMASLVNRLAFFGVIPNGTPVLKPNIVTETGQ